MLGPRPDWLRTENSPPYPTIASSHLLSEGLHDPLTDPTLGPSSDWLRTENSPPPPPPLLPLPTYFLKASMILLLTQHWAHVLIGLGQRTVPPTPLLPLPTYFLKASMILLLTPHWAHVLIGLGQFFPLTLIPSSSSRNASTSALKILKTFYHSMYCIS